MHKLSATLCLYAFIVCAQSTKIFQERFNWKQLDWAFPSEAERQQAIDNGELQPQNALPVGIEHYGNRLFVTVPRWNEGIPATLNYIDLDVSTSGSPQLIPYPDLASNKAGNCADSITTAYRIKADECGRLWVLDTGTMGIGSTTRNACPYAINIFDLATNKRIHRYEFRPEDSNAHTFIANTVVDIGKDCNDAYAYFADELGYGLISYSLEQDKSWRFNAHSFFFPDPLRGDFSVGGVKFQWGDEGIFGMSLSPKNGDGFRTLYFSPLASHRQFSVSTRILRDESRVDNSYHEFVDLNERGPLSHTTSHVMSKDGVELFNLIDQNAIGCWDSSKKYTPSNHAVVDRDDTGLIFPSDIKIDENEDVWVLSDQMPKFMLSSLDYSQTNFRIYTAPLRSLIENTVCDKNGPQNSRPNHHRERPHRHEDRRHHDKRRHHGRRDHRHRW